MILWMLLRQENVYSSAAYSYTVKGLNKVYLAQYWYLLDWSRYMLHKQAHTHTGTKQNRNIGVTSSEVVLCLFYWPRIFLQSSTFLLKISFILFLPKEIVPLF